jgi:hypothetical protein
MKSMALNKQMELFNEGGLKDEGGTIDPVSGNDVPSGSLQEEVRDDIDAKLSEGEFVFPADVVRYWGLETLMKLRQEAKRGLQKMEDMGQMGNSDEAILPDNIPFSSDDLIMEDDGQLELNLSPGGFIPPVQYNAPSTNTFQVPSQFANYSQTPSAPQSPYTYGGIAPVQYIQPVVPQAPIAPTPGPLDFGTLLGGVYKEYYNPEIGPSSIIQIRIIDGKPASEIPEGYVPYVREDVKDVDPVTDDPTDPSAPSTPTDDTSADVDTGVVGQTSVRQDDDDGPSMPEIKSAQELLDLYKDNEDAIILKSNGKPIGMPADNYNALLVSYGRLKDSGAFGSLQDYYDLPLTDRLKLVGKELKVMTGQELTAEDNAYIKSVYEDAKEDGRLGTSGIFLLDALKKGADFVADAVNNLLGGGAKESEVETATGGITVQNAGEQYKKNKEKEAAEAAKQKAAAEAAAKAQAEALAAQMAAIQKEKINLMSQGLESDKAQDIATSTVQKTQNKVAQDNQAAYEQAAGISTSQQDDDDDDDFSAPTFQSSYEQEAFGPGGASSFGGFGGSSTPSVTPTQSSYEQEAFGSAGQAGFGGYSSPSVQAAQDYTQSKVDAFQSGNFFGGFEKGGLASKSKPKKKQRRNKKGLGVKPYP